ncbi:MAG: FliA/WhiG family RNA polymerase sigma factor [Miltoncostaeaceae bacterium]
MSIVTTTTPNTDAETSPATEDEPVQETKAERAERAESEELAALWRRFGATRDSNTRERLVLTYAPLAKYVAGRIGSQLPSYIDIEDLTSYGLVGLLDAIDRFEPSRGVKFETFALTRIRGAIIDELRSLDWAPRALRHRQRQLMRAMASIEQREGRPATDDELASSLEVDVSELDGLLAEIASSSMVALEEVFATAGGDDERFSLGDAIEDVSSPDPSAASEHAAIRDLLADAIVRLPERERIVVSLYHYDNLSLREIGDVLGVTESRASQLRTKAIMRLRSALDSEGVEGGASLPRPS